MRFGAAFFETAVSSCMAMGKRAILLSQDHSQIPLALPKTILHQRYIPLNLMLPHAEAFVHPGGIGSLAQALAAGIPQLIMPMSQDQPDNAERIQRFGLGDTLFPINLSAGISFRHWKNYYPTRLSARIVKTAPRELTLPRHCKIQLINWKP